MNNTIKIIQHEYKRIIKSRGFQISTAIVIVLMLGGTFLLNIINNNSTEIPQGGSTNGYIDRSGYFNESFTHGQTSFIRYDDIESAQQGLTSGQVTRYLVFGENYLSDGSVASISIDEGGMTFNDEFVEALHRFITVSLIGTDVGKDVLDRLLNPYNLNSVMVDENGNTIPIEEDNAIVFLLPYIFTLFMVICIFTASGYLMQGLSEEKENRIMEVLLSSVSSKELLIGKIIGLGAVGLTQVVLWVITAVFVFSTIGQGIAGDFLSGISLSPDLVIVTLITFILGYLLFACLMGAFSVVGASAKDSQQYAMYFTLPAVLPIVLMFIILNDPLGVVSRIMTFFPLTAPGTIIMRYSIGELPIIELLLAMVVLIGAIAVTAWFANKMFRTFLLMYGKTPKISEIIKMLRQA